MEHKLYLIRHGQTEWNLAGRFQGRTDSSLTKKGEQQAADVGRILAAEIDDPAGFDFQVSPQGRTRETAKIALAVMGIEPRFEDQLMEVDVGEWSGLMYADIEAEHPEIVKASANYRWIFEAPGGETLDVLRARAEGWLKTLDRPTVAISHGAIGRQIRGAYLGLNAEESLTLPDSQGGVLCLVDGKERLITVD